MIQNVPISGTTPTPTVLPTVTEFIGITPGFCGGKPHVLGHRIKVQQIAIWHEHMGMNAEEIVATYPSLTLSAVYAALSYYHSHRAEIESDIDADEQFANEMKAKSGPSKLKAKLAELHAQNDPISPG
jgi:uncharacterized protein (DUF433 family)